MKDYTPIACELYDQYELVCIHHKRVQLTLKNSTKITGHGITLETRSDKSEYLLLKVNGKTQSIRLDTIANMES